MKKLFNDIGDEFKDTIKIFNDINKAKQWLSE
jgi:hypothetical protein